MNIGFKKTELIKVLIGGILLIAGSVALIVIDEVGNPVFDHVFVKYVVPVVGILFFGSSLIFISGRLFSNKPAVALNERGFTDNASVFAVGFVGWEEVAGIATASIAKQEFLVVMLQHPEKVIARQKNSIVAGGLKLNYKNYGSPCYIPVGNLDCSLEQVLTNFRHYLGQ